MQQFGLKLAVRDTQSRTPSYAHNEALAKLIRLWWTASPECVSEHDITDLIKAQLMMQGVPVSSVVMLSPVRVRDQNLLGEWWDATKDVWAVFKDPEEREKHVGKDTRLWAGDCHLQVLATPWLLQE